jgi:hypothetical protein
MTPVAWNFHQRQDSQRLSDGLLEPSNDFARRALDTLILTDIATAQSLTDTAGRLTQIDLILPDGFDTRAHLHPRSRQARCWSPPKPATDQVTR